MCKYIESRQQRRSEATSSVNDPFNIEECQLILDGIPDLDDKIYIKALNEFVFKPEWCRIFMRMSEKLRRAWLESMLG